MNQPLNELTAGVLARLEIETATITLTRERLRDLMADALDKLPRYEPIAACGGGNGRCAVEFEDGGDFIDFHDLDDGFADALFDLAKEDV